MLNNIALQQPTAVDEGTFPVMTVLHESISVPTADGVKASYDGAIHYEGALINASGLTQGGDYGAVVFVLSVPSLSPAPTREQILSLGLPLLPSGSSMELPKESKLDFYLATESASPITCKGVYFGRSNPAPVV
jgi:hypothetical protein